jgi:hypothetical protein
VWCAAERGRWQRLKDSIREQGYDPDDPAVMEALFGNLGVADE